MSVNNVNVISVRKQLDGAGRNGGDTMPLTFMRSVMEDLFAFMPRWKPG
jgi:hypothetical protein